MRKIRGFRVPWKHFPRRFFATSDRRAFTRRASVGRLEALEPRWMLSFDPTPIEQAYLESINRMRLDPQGELEVLFSSLSPLRARDSNVQAAMDFFRVDADLLLQQWSSLTPVPPVAWNELLTLAAEKHNDWMVRLDDQQHQLPGEPSLGDRVRAEGYSFSKVTENIYAYSESVMHGHAGFIIDWGEGPGGIQSPPGHRDNYLDPEVVEVGIDVIQESSALTSVGPFLVTQDFGSPRSRGTPFVLGVVWTDFNRNSIYDAGEGLSDVELTISGTGGTFRATSMTAGGYQVRVPAGSYQVVASGGVLPGNFAVGDIIVGTNNVKADIETTSGNRQPVAAPDNVTGSGTGFFTINVVTNDRDLDGQIIGSSVEITQAPTQGQLTVNPVNGVVTYWPVGTPSGADSFFYTVRDNRGARSEAARVQITFNAVNTAPVAQSLQRNALEDTPLSIPLSNAVSDPDNAVDWSTLQVVSGPASGSVTVDTAGRSLLVTPARDVFGTLTFTYRVSDILGAPSNTATVNVAVASQNDAPVAVLDRLVARGGQANLLTPLANDSDVDDALSSLGLELQGQPRNGSAAVENQRIRYIPQQGFFGLDSMRYRVLDPSGAASNPVEIAVLVADPTRPWRNPFDSFDVDWSGGVSPLDALLVINHLGVNLTDAARFPTLANGAPPFVDVTGDGQVDPLDALLVINQLGSSRASSPSQASALGTDDLGGMLLHHPKFEGSDIIDEMARDAEIRSSLDARQISLHPLVVTTSSTQSFSPSRKISAGKNGAGWIDEEPEIAR